MRIGNEIKLVRLENGDNIYICKLNHTYCIEVYDEEDEQSLNDDASVITKMLIEAGYKKVESARSLKRILADSRREEGDYFSSKNLRLALQLGNEPPERVYTFNGIRPKFIKIASLLNGEEKIVRNRLLLLTRLYENEPNETWDEAFDNYIATILKQELAKDHIDSKSILLRWEDVSRIYELMDAHREDYDDDYDD